MGPSELSAAINLQITTDSCIFTRIFLMWRGVSYEDMVFWVDAGEKEAVEKNWKMVIGLQEESQDPGKFRLLETSIMDCT